MTNKVQVDFSGTSGTVVLAAASASSAVPVNTELLAITATVATHFRIGNGAQTALVTDPMIVPGADPLIVKLSSDIAYTIAAIPDSGTTGTLSFFRVNEA